MNYDQKIDYMLKDLGKKGISKGNLYPPVYHLLRQFGLRLKPPIFCSFGEILFYISIIMTTLIYLMISEGHFKKDLMTAAFLGALLGLLCASYFKYLSRKYKLPKWDKYPLEIKKR